MAFVRTLVFAAAALAAVARSVAAADALQEPRGVLSLADALAVTLLRNPELQTYSWDVRAAEARLLQAGRRRNPEASLEVEDVLGSGDFSGAREAQVTLQLGQVVELGGKRAARVNAGERARDLTARDFEVKRVQVLAEATRRFIRLLARQDELALARADVDLADTALSTIERRISAGAESPLEKKKAVTARARAHIAAEHAEHELRIARRQLAAMWGEDSAEFERADGNLFATATVPSYETLAGRLADSPQLARERSELELRRAEIRLADSKRVPDVTVGGGARWLEGPGENAFLFGLSVPLPLADHNQGGSAEARALLGKSEASIKAVEARASALLFALYQELLHAATALDSLQREILPGAEDALVLSRNGFSGGRFSYLELADAQRTLVEVRKERIETAASYHEFALQIEELLGASIEGDSMQTGVER